MNITIYYFSATGNSLEVAREIARKTGGKLKSLVPLRTARRRRKTR